VPPPPQASPATMEVLVSSEVMKAPFTVPHQYPFMRYADMGV
jgi:hypothetical protein